MEDEDGLSKVISIMKPPGTSSRQVSVVKLDVINTESDFVSEELSDSSQSGNAGEPESAEAEKLETSSKRDRGRSSK